MNCIVKFSEFSLNKIKLLTRPLSLLAIFSVCFLSNAKAENGVSSAPGSNYEEADQAVAADKTVKGKVVDVNGDAIPGVTIIVLGTPRGVTTDVDGTFSIDVNDSDKLVFSYIGMDDITEAVAGKTVVNVTLKEKADMMEEVTVVAFGEQKKESVIGSITTIKPAELKIPSSNLTQSFAGRLAGMISYQRSGEPGADGAEFFIRGVATFGTSKNPLILIDNMESTNEDLSRMTPDDIESFSIMKDATATALYGARGANGVISIVTKTGAEGKAKFDLRYEGRYSTSTREVDIADPITYMELRNEAVLTRDPLGVAPYSKLKIANTAAGVDPLLYPATDWQEELMKGYTFNQGINASIRGGGKVARYYVSGKFTQDNGNLSVPKENNFNNNIDLSTVTLRANVNIALTKTTEFIVRMSGLFDDYIGPRQGGTAIYNSTMKTNPVMFPAYYEPTENTKFIEHILFGNANTDGDGADYSNPYAALVSGYKEYARTNMTTQLEVKQDLSDITQGLKARAMYNITRSSYFDLSRQYNPFYYSPMNVDDMLGTYDLECLNPKGGTEYLSYSEGSKTVKASQYFEGALNYSRTFNDAHNVSALLVFQAKHSLSGNAGDLQSSLAYRNLGLSGRATYGYKSRYFLEFNFGYNGSERFDEAHRWGFFPSAGFAWSISNEPFFAGVKDVITNMRLRGTYGLVGNDNIGSRFLYLSNMNMNDSGRSATFGVDHQYSQNGISTSRYANSEITWEVSYKYNLALEMGLFNRFSMVGEVYKERRTNILMTRQDIPTTMGLSANVQANVGEAKSSGTDWEFHYNHSFNKDMWLQGQGTFTYATSKYVIYEEPTYATEWWKSRIGYNLSQSWGYIADRLFIDDEEVANSPYQSFGEVMGGDIKYHDVNGDGKITSLDQVPIGYPTTPEVIYGFGLSYGYKKFDFSIFFQGSARSSFWVDASTTSPFQGETQLLQLYADNHWSEENRDIYALWPRLSQSKVNNNVQKSTWFMQDGAFLRFKQLEFGYTFPASFSNKLRMRSLRVYATGGNLHTWSKFKLWDVEMAGNGLGYPIQTTATVGINASF